VSNTYGCATVTSAPDSLSAASLPAVPIIAVTQTDYGPCSPDTARLTAAYQSGCTYNWYINDNAYPLNFTGDSAVATISGLFSVKVVNTEHCVAASGNTPISIPATAAPTAFIASSATVCRGVQGVTYTINPDSAATAYSWSYSGTGVTLNGDGTSVTADFGPGATSGNVSVQDSGYSCPGNITLVLPVQVDSIPGEPGNFIAPDTLIDLGNAAPGYTYSYNVPATDTTFDYEWSYSGLTQVQTYIDTEAALQFYNAATGGLLSVTASNECGTSPLRSIYVQVLLPVMFTSFTAQQQGSAVLITWATSEEINAGTFTLSRSSDSLTWTPLTLLPFSGNLQGDTYAYLDPNPGNGVNYYEVTGYPATGNDSAVMTTSISLTIAGPTVRIAPNPVTATANVMLKTGLFQELEIVDQLGNILLRMPVGSEDSKVSVPVNNLADGMYFLHMTGAAGLQKTVMFMKTN
jgi:hypothetical protein